MTTFEYLERQKLQLKNIKKNLDEIIEYLMKQRTLTHLNVKQFKEYLGITKLFKESYVMVHRLALELPTLLQMREKNEFEQYLNELCLKTNEFKHYHLLFDEDAHIKQRLEFFNKLLVLNNNLYEAILTIVKNENEKQERQKEEIQEQKRQEEKRQKEQFYFDTSNAELKAYYETFLVTLPIEYEEVKNFIKYMLSVYPIYKEKIFFNLISCITNDLNKTHIYHLSEEERQVFLTLFEQFIYFIKDKEKASYILYYNLALDSSGGLFYLCYFCISRKSLEDSLQSLKQIISIFIKKFATASINIHKQFRTHVIRHLDLCDDFLEYIIPIAVPEPPISSTNNFIKYDDKPLENYFGKYFNTIHDKKFLDYIYEKKDIMGNIPLNFIQIIFGSTLENLYKTRKLYDNFILLLQHLLTKNAFRNIENKFKVDITKGFLILSYYYCWKHLTKDRNYHKLIYIIGRIKTYIHLEPTIYEQYSIEKILEIKVDETIRRNLYKTIDPYKKLIYKLFNETKLPENNLTFTTMTPPAIILTEIFSDSDGEGTFHKYYLTADPKFVKYLFTKGTLENHPDVGILVSVLFDNPNLKDFMNLNKEQLYLFIEFMLLYVSPEIVLHTLLSDECGGMSILRFYAFGIRDERELNQNQLKKLLDQIKLFQIENNIKTITINDLS